MAQLVSLSLDGTWTLQQSGRPDRWPAAVPGDVHTTLIDQGVIPEPYVGANEPVVNWVGREDWIYSTEFAAGDAILGRARQFLEFDAIDTHATLFLNDEELAKTDNVFRRYRFDVTGRLRAGTNTLRIELASAHRVGLEKAAELPFPLTQGYYIRSPHMNLQRKVQCHGGWDWGPDLLQHGIPGAVRLVGVDGFRLDRAFTVQSHSEGRCTVGIVAEIEAHGAESTTVTFRLDGKEVQRETRLAPGINRVTAEIVIDAPKLWWPNGYGEQPLYDLEVEAGDQQIQKRLGLRSLELVREPDEYGESFFFRVNGQAIFCKGANWIPCDSIWSRQTDEVYTRLVRDAAAANMNMLRVWGGGQYEPEIFYDRCDEEGVLVWQDMMFACAPYPADDAFLGNVEAEIDYQIHRLRDHASIALWCGGNELLGSGTFKKQQAENPNLYIVNYDRMNRTVQRAVEAADPTRIFWPTSPCLGQDDFSGYWFDDSRGDTHYWKVGTGPEDFDSYQTIRPRFCSEFGMQGMASLETTRAVAESEADLNVTSKVMRAHQQVTAGNRGFVSMACEYFRLPNSFEDWVYLSQLLQAIAIKQATEFWRSTKPRCMGALFWQLNDVWPCASWSSLDYRGAWKQLHYHAKRFFDPLLIGGVRFPEEDRVQLFASSDLPRTAVPAEAKWRLFEFGGKLLREETAEVTLDGSRTTLLEDRPVAEWTDRPESTFLQLDLRGELEGAPFHKSNTVFFRRYHDLELAASRVRMDPAIVSGSLEIRLAADVPTFFVTLEGIGSAGFLDDNSITLLPGEERCLRFTPREGSQPPSLEAVRDRLLLQHLNAI